MIPPKYDLRPAARGDILPLFEEHHGYKSLGKALTYAFAVWEDGRPVAAFVWQPPAPGAAKSLCACAPQGVLALSRMVAVPRAERALRHISTPLRRQVRTLIDRGRWPVLVTYSDASLGHTGHVYKCSGWQVDGTRKAPYYEDATGARRSTYNGGARSVEGLHKAGTTTLTRWVHRACALDETAEHMTRAGWERVRLPGVWRSGSPKHRYVKASQS